MQNITTDLPTVRNLRTPSRVSADVIVLRPLVSMAIRMLGPGRLRLEAVKLSHDLRARSRAA